MSTASTDLTLADVQQIVQPRSAWKVVNGLIEKGLVHVYENMDEKYRAKKETYVFLHPDYLAEGKLQVLMNELETKRPTHLNMLLSVLHLRNNGQDVLQKELLKRSGGTAAQLKTMVQRNILETRKLETDRLRFTYAGPPVKNTLSPEQEQACNEIRAAFAEHKPALLMGVTGSGKTHVYFRHMQECIAGKKQALYLLPEIALTSQIVRKICAIFGERVAVYHSRFSQNERVEVWRKVMRHEVDIVIGARSALMLPFAKLGLVVVDEEHDSSYKQQDPAPRYHARDSALYLARLCGADVILGSATPALESYAHAKQGKYRLVHLLTRYGVAELPKVELIDTKPAPGERKFPGLFSPALTEGIKESLLAGKQVILFQNRRGYAPFLVCGSCGWVPQCNYCDVSLTYHKVTDQLHCHTCGSRSAVMRICPACGNNRIMARSFGTEKVEDEIRKLFPNARVQRFDWDAMRTKNKYSEIIRQFEKGSIDILVGTQMVVKGLDFEHVNLVGVLSADSLLSYPDFRVHERVFQLLQQVAGRAGRKSGPGRVLIQLYRTAHPVILQVQAHDYEDFFLHEMNERRAFHYPPFCRLIRITLKHRDEARVQEAAALLKERLQHLPETEICGPAEPPVARIRNQYLREVLLKTGLQLSTLHKVKAMLREQVALLGAERGYSRLTVHLDVDPY
jgi:primosomal protein N' (replication factor Y)